MKKRPARISDDPQWEFITGMIRAQEYSNYLKKVIHQAVKAIDEGRVDDARRLLWNTM